MVKNVCRVTLAERARDMTNHEKYAMGGHGNSLLFSLSRTPHKPSRSKP